MRTVLLNLPKCTIGTPGVNFLLHSSSNVNIGVYLLHRRKRQDLPSLRSLVRGIASEMLDISDVLYIHYSAMMTALPTTLRVLPQ